MIHEEVFIEKAIFEANKFIQKHKGAQKIQETESPSVMEDIFDDMINGEFGEFKRLDGNAFSITISAADSVSGETILYLGEVVDPNHQSMNEDEAKGISARIVDKMVNEGVIRDCHNTDFDDEFIAQEMISTELLKIDIRSSARVTEDQIKQDLISDFGMSAEEAGILASQSVADTNNKITETYNQQLGFMVDPSSNSHWIIDNISSVKFNTAQAGLYEILDQSIDEYLSTNNLTLADLNSVKSSANTITHNMNNIFIDGDEIQVKFISLALQQYLSNSDPESDEYNNLHFKDLYFDIDNQYQIHNADLSDQNFDLTDAHKNNLGIKVPVAGKTKKNNPLLLSLNDPDFYDFFSFSPTPSSDKWNDKILEIKDQFDLSHSDISELEDKLYIFSLLYSEQEKNPDWIFLDMSKRMDLVESTYNHMISISGDLDYDHLIETAIDFTVNKLRTQSLGLAIKTNSGTNYADGFTVTVIDSKNEYLGSIELYQDPETLEPYTSLKINQNDDNPYADIGLENLMLLKAISVAEDNSVTFNPLQNLIDLNHITRPISRRLEKANLINQHNGSLTLTPYGEKQLEDRNFLTICNATIIPRQKPRAKTNKSSLTQDIN